jgi:hypothetical protein
MVLAYDNKLCPADPVIDTVITLRLSLHILTPYLNLAHPVALTHLERDTYSHGSAAIYIYIYIYIYMVWPVSTFIFTKYEYKNESTIVWSSLSCDLAVSFRELLNASRMKSLLVTGCG